jgi:hypothetical protein
MSKDSTFVLPSRLVALRRLLCAAALLLVASGLAAQAPGSTPYATLYKALEPALEVRRFDRLEARANVQSKHGLIRPEQIRMEIRSGRGIRRLKVEPNGDLDFPLDDQLLSENPLVVSNQPKGSLTLAVTIMLRPFPTLRVPYREISVALAQVRQVIAQDPNQAGVQVRGVEVNFPPGRNATLAVRGRSEQLLMADASGRVLLTDADEWQRPDVEVEFSEAPLRIIPYLDFTRTP